MLYSPSLSGACFLLLLGDAKFTLKFPVANERGIMSLNAFTHADIFTTLGQLLAVG